MKKEQSDAIEAKEGILKGETATANIKIAVVVASYNTKISQGLLDGCIKGLDDCGITDRLIIDIDGSFELPLVAQECAKTFDAVICLGSVIKGDTAHFEYVSDQAARGIQEVMLKTSKPVIFGVLTTYDFAQALERSLPNENNKGLEAALTAVKMCNLLTKL